MRMRVTVALLASLAACKDNAGSKKEEAKPEAKPEPPKIPEPQFRLKPTPSLKLEGTFSSIQLAPTAMVSNGKVDTSDAAFDIRVKTTAKFARIATMCRVDDHNVVFLFDMRREEVKDGEASASFSPAPFKGVPKVCEVRLFAAGAAKDGEERAEGVFCYQPDALAAGECPKDSFPPPALPKDVTLGFAPTAVTREDSSISFRAWFTLGKAFPKDATKVKARCEGDKKIVVGEDDMGFVDLEMMPAGSSGEAIVAIFLNAEPAPDGRCELTFETKPPKGKTEKNGTYCVTGNAATPGPCVPALGKS